MFADLPHPDPRVLHAPGACLRCDRVHDWQMLRHLWGIAYTGRSEYGKLHLVTESRSLEEMEANAPVPPRG